MCCMMSGELGLWLGCCCSCLMQWRLDVCPIMLRLITTMCHASVDQMYVACDAAPFTAAGCRTCLTAMPMLHHGTRDTSTGKSWAMRRRLWCRQDVVPLYVAFNALLLLLYLLQIQWMAGIFRCNRQLQLTLTQVHHAAVLVPEMSLHSTPIASATVICR